MSADSEAEKAPKLGLGKALLFTIVTLFLGLALLEGVAMIVEPYYFPYKRAIPIAAPGAPGIFELDDELRAARKNLDPESRPSFQHMELPLVADEARRWALPANTEMEVAGVGVRVNSMGMRGPEVALEEGDVRLFTLGDSSVFGDGLEEIDVFSTLTAGKLAQAWGRQVQGIIGAVPGHDTAQSLNTLRHFGPNVKPSWVVIGNMWSDVYNETNNMTEEAFAYLPPVQGVLRNSAGYRILWRSISPLLNAQQVRWITGREDVGQDAETDTRVPLEQYVNNLRELTVEAKRQGARVAFLMLPAPMDFDELPVPDTVQRYRLAMRAVAEENGAPLVDGPAYFKAHGGDVTYFADQVHPNPDGHFLLGMALAEVLEPVGPPPDGRSHYPGYEPEPGLVPARLTAPPAPPEHLWQYEEDGSNRGKPKGPPVEPMETPPPAEIGRGTGSGAVGQPLLPR